MRRLTRTVVNSLCNDHRLFWLFCSVVNTSFSWSQYKRKGKSDKNLFHHASPAVPAGSVPDGHAYYILTKILGVCRIPSAIMLCLSLTKISCIQIRSLNGVSLLLKGEVM